MPCDMVRLPCGSMSTQRTRWPFSAKAAARLSVVVVFATPPFWLANAITFALASMLGGFARGGRFPARADARTSIAAGCSRLPAPPRRGREPAREAARLRHGQGRGGQDGGRRGARDGRRAAGQADDR